MRRVSERKCRPPFFTINDSIHGDQMFVNLSPFMGCDILNVKAESTISVRVSNLCAGWPPEYEAKNSIARAHQSGEQCTEGDGSEKGDADSCHDEAGSSV